MKINSILMRAAAVLLMLVLLSTAMVSGRFARYVSTTESTDSARVAKFSVTETESIQAVLDMPITPESNTEAVIQVDNDSEVAVRYTIVADNPYKNLPITFHVKEGDTLIPVPYNGTMAPGSTADYTLVAVWDPTKPSTDYIGRVDIIELTLTATQID